MSLRDIDLSNPENFEPGFPHHWFKRLRAEAPVFWQEDGKWKGFWALTKYDDIERASKDQATFSSARGATNIFDLPEHELTVTRTMMVNMDPPCHGKHRRLVNQGFTPRRVGNLESHIRELCARIVDAVCERGACDFVTDVAAELPLQVIVELMGVPLEDRHKIFDWSNRLIGFDDPEFQNTFEDGKIAAAECWAYANQLAQQRQQCPRDDLVSALMGAEVDGERLSEQSFDGFFLLLLVAGNETTRNLISGGMLALMENPAERARLLAEPSLLPTAIEEMLRWVTPVSHFRRTATRDVEVRGRKIREGDKVVIFYPSANRDEEVFADGDRFDVGRSPNDHLTFGIGEHFCLGANLARLEIRSMFEELLRRLPDMELAGPVSRLRSNFINGIKHMPVRFTPERRSGTTSVASDPR